jgi:ketosteroid isomerase-like protein
MHRLIVFSMLFLSTAALSDATEEVRCQEIGFSKSVENTDLDQFRSFLDDDARFVGNSVLRGPEAVTNAWGVFFTEGGPLIKWRPQFVEVLEDGNLALTRGPYRMIVKGDDGNTTETWGTFNSVWRRQAGGEWRVVFDAGSQASEAPAAEIMALLDHEDTCPE